MEQHEIPRPDVIVIPAADLLVALWIDVSGQPRMYGNSAMTMSAAIAALQEAIGIVAEEYDTDMTAELGKMMEEGK